LSTATLDGEYRTLISTAPTKVKSRKP